MRQPSPARPSHLAPPRSTRLLGLAAAAVATVGCGSVDAVVFLPDAQASRPDDHPIRIYRTTAPPCPFEEVGLLVWEPRHPLNSLEDGVAEMRERARRMGGDAIIAFSLGEQTDGFTTSTHVTADTTGAVSTTSLGRIERTRFATGTVVRFDDPSCARSRPSPSAEQVDG